MALGLGGALDTALERVAVIVSPHPDPLPATAGRGELGSVVIMLTLALLAGCQSLADVTGAAVGLASGAASGNPAVGVGVGIGVRAAASEGLKRTARARHRHEQDAIAAVVADMRVGETRAWTVDQRIADDAQGEVTVLRAISTPLAECKEFVFSVVDKNGVAGWFTTSACDEGGRWRWAAAEPAVGRWINLQ